MIQNNYQQRSYGQDKSIVSPIQLKNRPYDIQSNRAVQDEIRRNLGVYHLTAEFTEDTETSLALRIPGVVSFLCTLKKDSQIIGFGRGLSVISGQNRFLEKSVSYAANAALIDSVVRGVKVLGVSSLDFSGQDTVAVPSETYVAKPVENFVPITDKQKGFLWKLLESSDADEEEFGNIESLSRDQARQKISQLVGASDSKVNY